MATHKVAIVMGSDSDKDAVKGAAEALRIFEIDYEVSVISAHRTPALAHAFARDAEKSGFEVIIAAAGGAAHLAGVIASLTALPVIGVPMETKSLGGLDSLYSTVQMPRGVPVATVAIGAPGAFNAGVLAAQMLAVSDGALKDRVRAYKKELAEKTRRKNDTIGDEFKH